MAFEEWSPVLKIWVQKSCLENLGAETMLNRVQNFENWFPRLAFGKWDKKMKIFALKQILLIVT